jgi:predicted nucleotidyltransferase
MSNTPEKIRAWIRTELNRKYGGRIVRAILTGSRARGDHRADSDWDVVVVLRDARSIEDTGPLINEMLSAPDGNNVEIIHTNEEGLNHPAHFMTECRKFGEDL